MSLLTYETICTVALPFEQAMKLHDALGVALYAETRTFAVPRNPPAEPAAMLHVQVKLSVIAREIIPGDNISMSCALIDEDRTNTPQTEREMKWGFRGEVTLPPGWCVMAADSSGYMSYGRVSDFTSGLGVGEMELLVRRNLVGQGWCLFHEGKDTGHRFSSAEDAIMHAEDARIHGH